MGTDLFDYDQPVTAEGILDLFSKYPNTQHFQGRAIRWAQQHQATTVADEPEDEEELTSENHLEDVEER